MIRNAWHISGGTGASANSANKRVLVTNKDGSERVVEVKKDFGMKRNHKEEILKRLQAQGEDMSGMQNGLQEMNMNGRIKEQQGTTKPLSCMAPQLASRPTVNRNAYSALVANRPTTTSTFAKDVYNKVNTINYQSKIYF